MCTHVHTHTKTESQAQVPPTSPCSHRSFSLYNDFFHRHQQVPVNSSMQNLKAFYYMSQYRFECNKDYNYWAFMRSNIFPLVHASSAVSQASVNTNPKVAARLPRCLLCDRNEEALSRPRTTCIALHLWPPEISVSLAGDLEIKVAIFWCGLNIRPQCKEVWKAQPSTRDCAS